MFNAFVCLPARDPLHAVSVVAGLPTVALLFGLCAAANAMSNSDDRAAALKLIPPPHQLSIAGEMLTLVTNGKSAAVIITPENPDKKETLAAQWMAREIAALGGKSPQIMAGPSGIGPGGKSEAAQLVLATFSRKTKTLGRVAEWLDEEDRKLLGDPARCEQAYVIRCEKNLLAVVGGSAQGTLYGVMTLLQLFQRDGGNLTLPGVHVRDWPDFRYRMAENWHLTEGGGHRGRGWGYDWGDGVENYKNRVIGIFDRCLRYKINMICFSSDFYGSIKASWDGDAFPLEKELHRLAEDRGIRLMIGGSGILDKCRGNDALTKQLLERIHDYVRKTEPRFLYIHHEDHGRYVSTQMLWSRRSEERKRRWPNEQMAAADGAAGGFSHDYNALCDAIFSVKNADSGYDASRDCLVVLISPSYTTARESDDIWDKQLEYWGAVSKLLKYKRNVCLGFREQFLRGDNNKRRVQEMVKAIRPQGEGPGLFLFSVSPASLYEMGPLFAPVPAAMSKLNEGADIVYYMCGRIFQEPLILLNASHMWNTDSLGALEVPKTASQCYAFCTDGAYQARGTWEDRPAPGIYGKGGFLELACRRLYGTKAGKQMEKLYEMKTPVITYAEGLFDRWGRMADLYWDWKPELKRTSEALAHVEAALNEPDCNKENRPILERFQKCLKAGTHFAEIRLEFQELVLLAAKHSTTPEEVQNKAAMVEKRMQAMEAFLKKNFTYNWATPSGGDILVWNKHLADMRKVLSLNVKTWTDEMRVHQAADREEAKGCAPLLVNGDMESSGGWEFVRVTGKGQAGYADGGYVDDKASNGKRSYRIIKHEVKQDSHNWMQWAYFGGTPTRASWGEIAQELNVKPGQKYVVAFDVFANWGRTGSSGLLEYAALVDDKLMWSLDGACPKGWKRGGFFFVAESPKVRLKLRASDIKLTAGWRNSQGDSWWDNVRFYPVSENSLPVRSSAANTSQSLP